ncbi:hypothetical protein, partial [Phocaeicola sartorii]|uniref:hypothetical protein n=1 Tax=Phocaeicola sartorii TaxID=671267 RepID=UPI001C880EF5
KDRHLFIKDRHLFGERPHPFPEGQGRPGRKGKGISHTYPENSVHTRTIHIKHLQQSFAKLLPLLPPNPLKPRWTGPLKGWWHHLFLYRKKGCCHHFYPFLSQNVRKRGKRQEAEEDQTQGKEDGYGQTETGNRTGRTEPDEGQDIDRNLTGIRLRTARTTVAYSQSHSCNPAVSFCTHG